MKQIVMKKRTVIAVCIVLGLIAVAATATLIPSFNTLHISLEAEQGILFDGQDYNNPIQLDIGTLEAGCCDCSQHWIENNGCVGQWVDMEEWGDPDMEGIEIMYYEPTQGCCDHILDTLELEVLDGMAEWDDFDVQVDGIDVYSYDAQGGDPETWIMHTIDLTQYEIQCCGTHTVRVICTACEPWEHFDPYGQLAVNYAALYCEPDDRCGQCPPVLCDEVDIGDPSSEAGHNLIGWGPIEPANTGGGYGGINDCRCTWYPDDDDQAWATLELTCEDCYEQEPGCPDCGEGTPVEFPMYLEPESRVDFCVCVYLDPLIQSGVYDLYIDLVPWEDD